MMNRLKFCANLTTMFQDEAAELINRYDAAKRAGFAAVECAFPYAYKVADLADVKNKLGLKQVLINADPGESLGTAAIKGKEEEFRQSLKKSVEYCVGLGCDRLHIMSGKIDPNTQGSEETLKQNLRFATGTLQEHGIVGLIEPINHYSVPGYFLNNFELGERIVKEIDSPFLRLQLDLFHLQFLKGDLTNNIKRFIPLTGHIQIAQVPDRHEPDSAGEINYKYIFDVIDKSGYDGWIGLEYIPENGTISGLSWMTCLCDS